MSKRNDPRLAKSGSGRFSQRESARERFLDSGTRLFWSRGYAATTMADIVAAADSSAGNFYNFYSGKEDLLLAALDRFESRLVSDTIEPIRQSVTDPVERIGLILEAFRETLRDSDFRLGSPLGRLSTEVCDGLVMRARIARAFAILRLEISRCFESPGVTLASSVSPEGIAAYVVAVLEGAVVQAHAEQGFESFDASIGLLRTHLYSLVTRTEAETAAA